jgi:general secretion pathway protein G
MKMRRKSNRPRLNSHRRGAFTLMEVLLVLAILVILGGMVTLMYQNVQRNANSRAAKVQISLFQDAVRMYQLNTQGYPNSLEDLLANNSGMDDATWGGPYLKELPKDPWGQAYEFKGGDPPVITSPGPDRQANTGDDITG